MPFVTVVSLGASAASEFITSAISNSTKESKKEKDPNSTLRGLKIRRVGEDEYFSRDSIFRTSKETTSVQNAINNSNGKASQVELIGSVRRKSVSFIDISSVGKLSLPPASESGYSSGSSGSSNTSCENSVVVNHTSTNNNSSNSSSSNWWEKESNNNKTNNCGVDLQYYCQPSGANSYNNGLIQNGGPGSIQAKTTVLKSWLRNKLHLNKNGKYSFEGSLNNLAHFGVKVNKSLLVECTPETEYSTKKFYTLKTITNTSAEQECNPDDGTNQDILDCSDDSNLFIRECLKTYTTPFVQLVPDKIIPLENITINNTCLDVVDSGPISKVPKIEESNANLKSQPPEWFWTTLSQNHGIHLDEAGVALEGHFSVTYVNESFGDRFVQVKWDNIEEIFWLIVWKGDAGNDFICKLDIGEVSEVEWLNENKLCLENKLILCSEKRIPQSLRNIYVICSELGCYEKSAILASPENVERVTDVVQLFQKVVVELSHEKKQAPKPPPKPKLSPTGIFTFQLEGLEFRLKTESGTALEPYYVSVCLFDVKNGRKASEDFHCTVDMFGNVNSKKALFRVSEANENLFIVIRVEKTLQGTDSDVYYRGNPDGKAGSRISKTVITSPLYTENQQYRMPLCWSARNIFNKPGSRSSSPIVETPSSDAFTLDIESSFSPFYKYEKTDEELIKVLADIRKPEKVAKLTVVPGSLRALIHEIKNWDEIKAQSSSILSINEFPSHSIETFSRFSHLLYVYPILLNLTPVASKIRARNIVCRVFLRTEDDIDASPLDTNPENGAIATYVLHHRTNPEWYSEIKISLPVTLDPRLHLLFQFIHISCSFDKVTKAKQLENIVGYAWIPLLNKFRFIGGEHLLPIASSLPSGYLQIQPLGLGKGYSGPDIGWLEKCTFSVKLNLLSTVWTKCGPLGAFFAHSERLIQKGNSSNNSKFLHCDDENTIKTIKTLESMDLATLRDFFPTIINQLCSIARFSKPISNAVLKFMIFAFHSMIEAGLESVIQQYTKCRLLSSEPAKEIKQTLAETLIDAWIDLFEIGDGATIATSLEHSEHLFSMIIKSIALEGYTVSNINPEDSKLVKLIQLFTTELVQRSQSDHLLSRGANDNLIKFISAALSVMTQRSIVFASINAYLSCFGPGDSHKVQDFKFILLQSLVEHPLFLELNSLTGDEESTRLDNIPWAKRHFLLATVMKQSRSGLGEVSNVRTSALKPIVKGLILHEKSGMKYSMWTPWLRVVCDNLHRVSAASLSATHSSRCSSVSTILSATAGTLVQAALNKSLIAKSNNISTSNCSVEMPNDNAFKKPSLSVRSSRHNGHAPSMSTNSSMTNISSICAGSGISNGGDRLSLDRLSITNCDYLDAISAIKLSNPAASNVAESTGSGGSGTETIVNDNASNNGSGDRPNSEKESEMGHDEFKASISGNGTDATKSNVVLRRYDKLNDLETSQLLLSGLYVLKSMGRDGLKTFWTKGTTQERAGLLQMIHLACSHFTNARKNSTITRKKVVGILVPPTQPPSPRSSVLPNKKWSSLPTRGSEDDDLSPKTSPKKIGNTQATAANDWKSLGTETTFICVDTLANLCTVCNGENNEMRDVIRTTLDVAKTSEDTRAMLGALENVRKIDELANIVFAKGNEDLSHQLFCEVLHGFGTSYLLNTCVAILGKLYLHSPQRTTSQSLVAISSLSLKPDFVHNFRNSLCLLENGMSLNERSSFILSITEKLNFIDVQEFDAQSLGQNTLKAKQSLFRHLTRFGSRKKGARKLNSPSSLPIRLGTVLNSLWLLKSCQNDYRISELYLKLANSYSHFAKGRLRIDSFDSLKEEHLARKRFSEALLCELHVACCLGRYSATPEVKKILLGISQNLKDDFEEISDPPEDEDTTEELILRLENCVALCEKAERYELMLEVYRILVDIQESLSDYAALEHSYKQMSRACGLIQNKRERFLATYYRVAIYYPKKDNLKRPVDIFVYKEPNVTSLMEICNKVEAAESAIIVSGEVDQMPDDDNVYATITHLSPVPSESPRRKLWTEDFRRHQNVKRFTYDTPFTVKSQDRINVDNKAAVHQQWKRRTIITTDHTFPAVVTRLKVISAEEEDLSPIVVAIDDMQRRVTELRSEVHSMDVKRLQLRLQGSVSVQVNQGPLAYARAFLEKENEYPLQDINTLKNIFRDFVECCGELLIRNAHLISAEQADYQTQLESDYTRLCQVLSPVLGLPEIALNRMSRISVSSY